LLGRYTVLNEDIQKGHWHSFIRLNIVNFIVLSKWVKGGLAYYYLVKI